LKRNIEDNNKQIFKKYSILFNVITRAIENHIMLGVIMEDLILGFDS